MSGTPRPTRTDPVALIAGILMLLLASGVLWMAFGGPPWTRSSSSWPRRSASC